MKIKKNDNVLVTTGKDAGKTGKVIFADPEKRRVKVEGVNIQKRHRKPRGQQDQGGIIEQIGSIDVSNVMIVCPSCNKATRVGFKVEDGKKVRVCKKCGAFLDSGKEVKEVKKAAAKKTAAKEPKKTTKKTKKDAE